MINILIYDEYSLLFDLDMYVILLRKLFIKIYVRIMRRLY